METEQADECCPPPDQADVGTWLSSVAKGTSAHLLLGFTLSHSLVSEALIFYLWKFQYLLNAAEVCLKRFL